MSDDGVADAVTAARGVDVGPTIAAWRASGADRVDPVRFRFIEALARRASGLGGNARRLLDDRLVGLVAAYATLVERASSAGEPSGHDRGDPAAVRSALAELVDHIARSAPPPEATPATGRVSAPSLPAPPELKALSYFRSTWAKLNTEQRLAQSLARLPGNAGPLNSHHLVHRSLTLMRDLSPGYLDKFMAYVDALLWFDQLNGAGAVATKDGPRA
ncbi:DUF2894 domain-containing protein [Ideonella sp.]|uniref:DUF2894 domain-containing protein n=1 Tax=Ideonella sp. TaxID=1929293 RepID=UPI0035AE5D61